MVSDKSQARSTGPVMAVTRQPVKGRKRHGGIRLGEMERDALLSHGVSYCLHDRLLNCSDLHVAYVCATCGDFLTVYAKSQSLDAVTSTQGATPRLGARGTRKQYCHLCESDTGVRAVQMPYVFRYLTNELAGMGIRLALSLSE
jgi:DNA-directed RNA polymerase I subunit RPA2